MVPLSLVWGGDSSFFFFFPSRQQLAANSEVSAEAGTCCELSPTAHTGYTLSFSSFCLSFLVLSTLLVLKKKGGVQMGACPPELTGRADS